ncbi:MAG: PEP-utilizing enzyme [Candidatus Micrarchaeota archaeon]
MKTFYDLETDFNGAPFASCFPPLGTAFGWKKVVGFSVSWALDFHDSEFQFCLDDGWMKGGCLVFEKVKQNPQYVEEIERNVVPLANAAADYAIEVSKMNLKEKSNAEMCEILDTYIEKVYPSFAWGLLLPALDFEPDMLLTHFLQGYLKKNFPQRSEEMFSILTVNTVDKTYGAQEEESFLQVCILPEAKQQAALVKHSEKFIWIPWAWRGPTKWGLSYYVELLASMKKDTSFDAVAKLKEKQRKITEIKKKQIELEKLVSPEMREMFYVARKISWLKPYRKEIQIKSIFYFEQWLKEASRRTGVPLELFRFQTLEEMKNAINGKPLALKLLQERRNSCVCIIEESGLQILSGVEAVKFREGIVRQKLDKNVKELRGATAVAGKVIGIVKIVNSAGDFSKMNQGDILVSVSTNPALLPVIKKAAAIITDTGGLTCHAAIVSRELHIPCITGTKVGTKVLKDGDKVEVDADKGVVRRV